MVRAHDLAGDARVLYGPLSQRPTPAEAGSGALWVDPSDQTLYHVQSGNWVAVSPASDGGGGGAGAGTPVLYGPYTVDYTDIPHDGDTHTLWTPQVGDVLLRLFPDWQTVTQWDNGMLVVGQAPDATGSPWHNVIDTGVAASIGRSNTGSSLDMALDAGYGNQVDAAGALIAVTAIVFHSTTPLQIQLAQTGDTPPTQGHVELYALVARAVAP